MKVKKTLEVLFLLILLLSEGGEDAVDDGHFSILGTRSLYLTLHLKLNLQTPALKFHLHGPIDKAGATWHLDAPDLVGGRPGAKTILDQHPGSNSAVESRTQTLSVSKGPVFDGQATEPRLDGLHASVWVSTTESLAEERI